MDVRDAILGNASFARPGPAEPTLLPYLATVCPVAMLPRIATFAREFAGDAHSGFQSPWLVNATVEAITRRAPELDSMTLLDLAGTLPRLAAQVPLDLADAVDNPVLLANMSVLRNDPILALRALNSANYHDQRLEVRGVALKLLGGVRETFVDVMDEFPHVELGVLADVAGTLDADDQTKLIEHWLASADAEQGLSGIVAILPKLADEPRRFARERGQALFDAMGARSPAWRTAFAGHRLRQPDPPPASDYAEILGDHDFSDVLNESFSLSTGDTELILERMASEHRAHEAALGSVERSMDDGGGTPPDLFLNAHVEEVGADKPPVEYFVRGREYRVTVNLAIQELARGIATDTPVPIDRSVDRELAISFSAAWLPATAPKILHVLRQDVETEPADVQFEVPAEIDHVKITVTISEAVEGGYKFLQSALLSGTVVDAGMQGEPITFRVDASIARPAKQTAPDVSIVLDDKELTVYAGPRSLHLDPPARITEFRAKLGDRVLELSETTDEARFVEELAKLTARGNGLLRELKQRLPAKADIRELLFDGRGTIQILSRNLDDDLPIEFVYDGPEPDRKNPRLCEHFYAALADGACRNCRGSANAICAFNFWGIRRRIERGVIYAGDPRPAEPLRARARSSQLPSSLGPTILGASARVKAPSRSKVLEALSELGIDPDTAVSGWDDWQESLRTLKHRLLVLMAHSEQHGDPVLEIERDRLDNGWIENYVNPHGTEPGPLVLLTGCDTARTEALVTFVSAFLYGGASIAVGTLAEIDEAVSARATTAIVTALRDVLRSETKLERRSVGEVMRRVRGQLLANHDMTGFNLVAYGDAEWRFALEDPS